MPIALMNEVELLKEWVPGVTTSGIIKDISTYRKVITAERAFPWPMASREFFICASAMVLKERKGVLIILR